LANSVSNYSNAYARSERNGYSLRATPCSSPSHNWPRCLVHYVPEKPTSQDLSIMAAYDACHAMRPYLVPCCTPRDQRLQAFKARISASILHERCLTKKKSPSPDPEKTWHSVRSSGGEEEPGNQRNLCACAREKKQQVPCRAHVHTARVHSTRRAHAPKFSAHR
jgi:hypothetical protein